jgi:peptidoglycan/LPS O-acetylase OafA/YrhL
VSDRPTLAYSPALDGLRAVSVLVIMAYHGGASWLSGGFLAVDIFFVLSGFLITSLLLLEYQVHGRLDLRTFWARRARRLLPALFVMLLAVLIYGAFLAGDAAATVRRDAVATLVYMSNWWFIASGNSYFEQFQDPSPLTHTWSLAIEEQWYLILPLVLVLLLPRMRDRRWLAFGLGAAALISALDMALLASPETDASRVYYGTDTRIQSLLVGALLAVLLTPGVLQRITGAARWLGGAAALTVVGFVLLTSDQSVGMYYGGFLAFAGATGLLLASVQARPEGRLATTLSWGPLVWTGKISYGLYLWHWPVYVILSPERVQTSGPPLLVVRFAVTFALAALSYYYVEMPIRRGALARLPSRQRFGVVLLAPLTIVGVVGLTTACSRPPAPDSLESIAASATRSASPVASEPIIGDVRAILLGDSVALSMFSAYRPGLVPGLSVLPGTEFGCGLVPYEVALNGAKLPVRAECKTWEQQRAQRIASSGANLGVMFAGPWEQYDRWIEGEAVPFTDPRWQEATVNDYGRVLAELSQLPAQAVVLDTCHGVPELDLPDAVLFQAGRYPAVVNDPARVLAVNKAAREAVRRTGRDIPIIDPGGYLCDDGEYRASIDGVPMHTDGVHFTEEGARLYWDWLGPRLLKAGPRSGTTPSPPAG